MNTKEALIQARVWLDIARNQCDVDAAWKLVDLLWGQELLIPHRIEESIATTIYPSGCRFYAQDKLGSRYLYELRGVKAETSGEICLHNVSQDVDTVVEPAWFRERIITFLPYHETTELPTQADGGAS